MSRFVVHGARVFDGVEVLDAGDLLVDGERIARVDASVDVPDGTDEIDGKGHTLLPGLIDAHVHTWYRGHLVHGLTFGVTTELDMFTHHAFAASMRAEQEAGGADDRADMFSVGICATCPGGHGTEYGMPIPTLERPDEAEAFVRDRIAEGSDWIKIIYGSGRMPSLSRETVAALIEAAHAHNRRAVVHVLWQRNALEVLEDGADALAHIFMDQPPVPELATLAKQGGAFVVPTLTVIESAVGGRTAAGLLTDERLAPFIPNDMVAQLDSSLGFLSGRLEHALDAVRSLHEAGVPICAGTDAMNPGTAHGVSIHRELELLVDAGLSATDALRAATSVPAECFGLDDRGRIAAGLRADLILVRGDPTSDILATRDIARIWKGGVPIERVPIA